MINFKTPAGLIWLVLFFIFAFMFFAFGMGVIIPTAAIAMMFLVVGIGGTILYFMRQKMVERDTMSEAMNFVIEWWARKFNETLALTESQGLERWFGGERFFGFIFNRSSKRRFSVPMSIVLKKLASGFAVSKYRELASYDDRGDPFVILSTKYAGSPVQNPQIEPWGQKLIPTSKKDGININVGDKQKEEWDKILREGK